jgi:hypothetical protein
VLRIVQFGLAADNWIISAAASIKNSLQGVYQEALSMKLSKNEKLLFCPLSVT